MQIETKRLILREHRAEDFDRFWGMITDPIAKRYTGGVTTKTYEERLKLFEEDYKSAISGDNMEFAVIEKNSMKYIGYCGYRVSENLGGKELFYGYCRDSWGQGYGFEAADAAVRYFFDDIRLSSLMATYDEDNIATEKILTHLGFKPVDLFAAEEAGAIKKVMLCNPFTQKYASEPSK